jgi:hypothetical protein
MNDVPGTFIEKIDRRRRFVFKNLRLSASCPRFIVMKDLRRGKFALVNSEPSQLAGPRIISNGRSADYKLACAVIF